MSEPARILIVDDEPAVQKLLVLTFRERPWHVEAVGTADEALARCRRQPYDLLVLDKNLPGMTGCDLLRILREEGDMASCIMMTAYASAESAVEMMALGVDSYLEKPFDNFDDVGLRVAEVLAKRRQSQGLAQAREHFRQARALVAAGGIQDPLHVLAVCPSQADREFLNEHLPEDLEHLLSSSDLMERLPNDSGDLVIVDAVIAGGGLVDFVREIRRLAPEPGLVVISDSLPLKVVTGLIDAGVDVLVERPLEASTFRGNTMRLLERLRG